MSDSVEPTVPSTDQAPSDGLSCTTYLGFWVAGHQGGIVHRHVAQCALCKKVLFGDAHLFPDSLDQETEALLVADDRRRARRRLLFGAAAGIAGIMIGFLGWKQLGATKPSNAPPSVPLSFLNLDARLDQAFASGGDNAIRQVITATPANQVYFVFDWIARRGKTSLFGDVVTGLTSPQQDIVRQAISVLWHMPPVSLKPHLATLQGAISGITNPKLQTEVQELIVIVTKS